eukprot:CAMPEP_0182445798 /NCGR_PEP_ID=MMETSP1172-20130603/3795_1 /TAXON_ID=708627 /ORGANISM="Timspurckia oligopyrenoides, Strain CCMP3278" /LENGTH=305 /DNA_ID=CAMNT_0024641623 /DNA_START=118 /DNA_END=1035 /DNA_ORIENTATION=+
MTLDEIVKDQGKCYEELLTKNDSTSIELIIQKQQNLIIMLEKSLIDSKAELSLLKGQVSDLECSFDDDPNHSNSINSQKDFMESDLNIIRSINEGCENVQKIEGKKGVAGNFAGIQKANRTKKVSRRRVPLNSARYWSTEEHQRFLDARKLFGSRDYLQISSHVGSRSPVQVRSHTQKYEARIERESPGFVETTSIATIQSPKVAVLSPDHHHGGGTEHQMMAFEHVPNTSIDVMSPLTANMKGDLMVNSGVNQKYDENEETMNLMEILSDERNELIYFEHVQNEADLSRSEITDLDNLDQLLVI